MNQLLVADLGLTFFFGRGGMTEKNLLDGWALPEENHNWNDGFEASLAVALPALPDTTCILQTEVRPHLGAGVTRQDVTLYFNGYRLGFWRLDSLEAGRLEAEIEPEYWLKRSGGVFGKCTWHLPDSIRPREIANTQDDRLLGLCFRSITIARKTPNLRR